MGILRIAGLPLLQMWRSSKSSIACEPSAETTNRFLVLPVGVVGVCRRFPTICDGNDRTRTAIEKTIIYSLFRIDDDDDEVSFIVPFSGDSFVVKTALYLHINKNNNNGRN